jgi:tRNA(fMet)-specific endonuclease VapC
MPVALIDTDTLSEIIKAHDPQVQRHSREYLASFSRFTFSIITRYEILRGLAAKAATRQVLAFEDRCRRSDILPLTDEIVVQAADIYGDLSRKGQLISDADILIAATALVNRLVLVTENVAHSQRIPGLRSESWRVP